jgi:hypothetical protein
MSKTVVVALAGIASLTVVGLAVVGGAIAGGVLGDGATVGLIGTIVGGIGMCVTAVSSRAQSPTAKAEPRDPT